MPSDRTDDAIHPDIVYSITAKALIGENPPSSIPQNNKGRLANANADRFAIVGVRMANKLVRINGMRAFHGDAPLPNRKSY